MFQQFHIYISYLFIQIMYARQTIKTLKCKRRQVFLLLW